MRRRQRANVDDLIAFVEDRWERRNRLNGPKRFITCKTASLLGAPVLGMVMIVWAHPTFNGHLWYSSRTPPPFVAPFETDLVPYHSPNTPSISANTRAPSMGAAVATDNGVPLFTVACDREIAAHFMRSLPSLAYAVSAAMQGGRGNVGAYMWGREAPVWRPSYGWVAVGAMSLATWWISRIF